MKIKSLISKFCKYCKCHQIMKLDKEKKGTACPNSWINRQKARYIGSNKGKYSKPPKKVVKNSKKGLFRLLCNQCKHVRVYVTKKTKKVEIIKMNNYE